MDVNAIDTAAELGRELANAQPAEPYQLSPDTSIVVRAIRQDERIETVDLERLLDQPRRQRGVVTVHEPQDFALYVRRLEHAGTTVWADENDLTITAVFNDHASDGAGWRDHVAKLMVRRDPDWVAWTNRDNVLTGQAEFAEHLEDQAHVIVEPDAATMLEVATSFHARRDASFSQRVKIESGDVQLAWTEETNAQAGASGRLEVPRRFRLRIVPFVGVQPIEVMAALRYRIKDGRLGIGYKLHRPDVAERESFTDIVVGVGEAVESPVLRGAPPRLARSLLPS